jgi:hypothetical protein
MNSANVYYGESTLKDDSASNRLAKIKLTDQCRNPDQEGDIGKTAIEYLASHSCYKELYALLTPLYEPTRKEAFFKKCCEYQEIISKRMNSSRIGDIECFAAYIFIDLL